MASTAIDQLQSAVGSKALKIPCKVATTANITLQGEQAIDGVAIVSGDRVLVKDQTTGSENGVYIASTGNWARSVDFNDNSDIVNGTEILVTSGTSNSYSRFYVQTADPITIGTTSLTISSITDNSETAATIKTKYESNADTNVLTDAEKAKIGTLTSQEYYETSVSPPNDITTALNAAIQAQKSVKIPAGEYACGAITLKEGVPVYGIPGATKLVANAGSITMLNYTATTSLKELIVFEGIALSTGGNASVTAGYIDGASTSIRVSRVRFKSIDLEGTFLIGLRMRYCANSVLEDVFSVSSTEAFRIDNCADTKLIACKAQNGTGTGFNILGGTGAFDEGIQMIGCSTNGQYNGVVGDGQDFLHMSGCSITTAEGGALSITSCKNWLVTGSALNSSPTSGSSTNPAVSIGTGCDVGNLVGNYIFGSTYGVSVTDGEELLIANNNLAGNSNSDLNMNGTLRSVVSGNIMNSTGVSTSIVEAGTANFNKIIGNNVNGTITTVGASSSSAENITH